VGADAILSPADGRVLVAEHWLSNIGGKDPVDRILCIHPDGKITLFADKLYAVFGLQYVDGKVYVHHYPVFSVFTDGGTEGKDRKDIINQTGKATIGGLNDHIAAQIRLAISCVHQLPRTASKIQRTRTSHRTWIPA